MWKMQDAAHSPSSEKMQAVWEVAWYEHIFEEQQK